MHAIDVEDVITSKIIIIKTKNANTLLETQYMEIYIHL